MQCKLLIAFVLIGACLMQTTSAQPSIVISGVQRGVIDNAINTVNELIQKTREIIQRQIDEALNTFNELKQKVTEQVGQAIETMRQKLNEIIVKAKEAIEDIKRRAEKAGVDISDCVKDNEAEFQNMFENFLADEIHCVTGEVEKIQNIITETVLLVTNALDSLKNFQNELLNCRSNARPLSCVTEVSLKVAESQAKLPVEIAKKIQEVTEFVTRLQIRLETCAVTQLTKAGVTAVGVVTDITKCAIDKGLE